MSNWIKLAVMWRKQAQFWESKGDVERAQHGRYKMRYCYMMANWARQRELTR